MICIDTNTLIFGVQRRSSPEHQTQIEAASYYLRTLKSSEIILVPSPVAFEYVQGFPTKFERDENFKALSENFFIPGFDALTARLAAEISATCGGPKGVSKLTGLPKPDIRLDIQIIATAIIHQASTIITFNESEFNKIISASGMQSRVRARWVTSLTQPSLFGPSDSTGLSN